MPNKRESVLKKKFLALALATAASSVVVADTYTLIDLGTLPDATAEGRRQSFAYSINDSNVVVGTSGVMPNFGTGSYTKHGYIATFDSTTKVATMTDIGHLGGNESAAFFVDSVGNVYGYSSTAVLGSSRGFVFDGLLIQNLGLPDGSTQLRALGKEQSGLVVGYSDQDIDTNTTDTVVDYRLRAVVRNPSGDFTFLDMLKVDGEAITKGISIARSINSAKQVVGYASPEISTNKLHPVRWDFATSSAAIDLGTLGGGSAQANDINEAGLVVGLSQTTGDIEVQPFVYDPSQTTAMIGLGQLTAGMTFGEAYAINNNNEIVGTSVYIGGMRQRSHATYYKYVAGAGAGANDNKLIDLNDYLSCSDLYDEYGQQKWELNEARDINNNGVIVGHGTVTRVNSDGTQYGEIHAFALVPPAGALAKPDCSSFVVEEENSGGSLPLGLLALTSFIVFLRRSRR